MPNKKTTEPKNKDVLEAYPTRLHVSALPDRRFFRMTRTLTMINALLVCLLIVQACFFYYAMDHQDIDIKYPSGRNALYRLDPESKTLRRIARTTATYSPLEFSREEMLLQYIKLRHSIVRDRDEMERRLKTTADKDGDASLLAVVSSRKSFIGIEKDIVQTAQRLERDGRVRDVHIYDLKHEYRNLWTATIDLFDVPVDSNLESYCQCQDNSQECLDCKIQQTRTPTRSGNSAHKRYKLWIRLGRKRPASWQNPFGFSIDNYAMQELVIQKNDAFWGVPASLQPDM